MESAITGDSSEIPREALAPALPRESVPPSHASQDAETQRGTGIADVAKARELFDAGRVVEARAALGAAINRTPGSAPPRDVRELAARIADESVFSSRITRDDPLVEVYTVQPNELLSSIARRFQVPYEIVMRINNISDAARLRAGQRIKIPRGPFHARIHLSEFRIDLYLQDTYVRSYPVGVGRSDTGTPAGVWQVSDRLVDPTYYPPPSAPGRPIVPGGRPDNPLGTRWIGLKGVEGGAVGQQSFGVHGTNEPDSVGSAASMGCIRMRDEDVQFVYDALTPGHSTVTTVR
ncbi:MAG: L,D-transpeptidase family protein [Phycisphaerae bacterium]